MTICCCSHSKKYHKYTTNIPQSITNIPQKYYKVAQKCDVVPQNIVGYEPTDLTVHPSPKTVEGGLIFFVQLSSVPKKMSPKKSPYVIDNLRLLIHVKRPKNVFFEHIHSNLILIN